jgi:TolA-binding protein
MQRWRDDRQVLDELGLEASAFDASDDLPNVVDIKRRLEARIAEGAQPILEVPRVGVRWTPWIGAAAVVMATAGLWWVVGEDATPQQSERVVVEPQVLLEAGAPAAAPSSEAVAMPSLTPDDDLMEAGDTAGKGAESLAVEPLPSAAPLPVAEVPDASREKARKRPRPTRRTEAVTPSPAPDPKPVQVEASTSHQEPPIPEVATEQEPAPRMGDLQAQLALYEAGRGALRAGNYAAARGHFEAYLSRFSDGELRQEAEVSLLEALVRSGRHRQVAAVAGRLAKRAGLVHRRGEFLRVRAESLARLGRCDTAETVFAEAVQAQAGLDATGVLEALRHCRDRQEAQEQTP